MAITQENAANCTPNTAMGESVLRCGHAQYSFAVDGGAQSTITMASNCTIPANAVVMNAGINSSTACAGATATIAVGLSAGGGGTTSLLGATAVASFTTNAKLQSAIVPQTASGWLKLSAAAQVTVTIATANLTAGIIEIYVFYYVSST